jgi:hypothetical protein
VIPTFGKQRETDGAVMAKPQVRGTFSVSRPLGNTGKRPLGGVFPARRYVVAGTRRGTHISGVQT